MTNGECRKGEKVVCVNDRRKEYGKHGIIVDVVHDARGVVQCYFVHGVDGKPMGPENGKWYQHTSWVLAKSWALSFAPINKPLSKECPCGIYRTECVYHKC